MKPDVKKIVDPFINPCGKNTQQPAGMNPRNHWAVAWNHGDKMWWKPWQKKHNWLGYEDPGIVS